MAPKKTHITSVRMSQELADALQAYSFVSGLNVNQMLNDAAAEYLKARVKSTVNPDKLRQAFSHVVEEHIEALKKVEEL